MTTRKLNALELKIHQAALSSPEKTLSQKELIALAPDVNTRTEALNFLLGTGMLKAMTRANGVVSAYRAVAKREMDVKRDMSGEEEMVLDHIRAAANKGIWTKHLKAKTELHQTVIDRCIKSLLQKQLIKVVKSVEHRTRKMYMLFDLEPSVELTGGPWYTDNELDTEFIKTISDAIRLFIKDRSFPKQKRTHNDSPHNLPLFPISSAPSYPTAQQIQSFLCKSKITETRLSVEHIEMLLNVLILEGEIERIPAFGAALWESNVDEYDEEDHQDHAKKKKRKHSKSDHHHDEDEDDKDQRKSKRRKQKQTFSDSEDKSPKRSKKRRRDNVTDTAESDDHERHRTSKKNRKSVFDGEQSNSKKSKKSKHISSDNSSSSSSATSSDEDSDSRGNDDKHSRLSKKSKSRKWSMSPVHDAGDSSAINEAFRGSAHVYRAIRQERVVLGWSQAPCGRCPVFDFCKDKGPVNPKECTYYEQWLGNATVTVE